MNTIPQGYKDSKAGLIPKEWNVFFLNDLATKSQSKNNDGKIQTVFSNSAINGIVLQNEYFDKDIAQRNNLDGYYIVEYNDFVYNPRISKNAPAGPINRNSSLKTGVVSPLYTVFKLKSNDNIEFLEHFFKSTKWLKYMMSIANYGARHDRMNITNNDFFKMPIPIPPKDEKNEVVKILTIWDEAINQQKALVSEKKQLRKGLMQKLLSGEKRFNEFDDEWVEVKLGTIFKERSKRFKDLDTEELEQYSELLSVSISNGVTKKSEDDLIDNSSSDKSNYKILKKNDIAYNTMRMWQGASGVSNYDGIVSPAYTIVTLKRDYSIEFFGYLFKLHRVVFDFYRYSQGLTSDTWNIKYPHFSEVEVKIPTSKLEQNKIVNTLKSMDKEVALLTQELEELKQQKKGLMQNLLTGKVRVKV